MDARGSVPPLSKHESRTGMRSSPSNRRSSERVRGFLVVVSIIVPIDVAQGEANCSNPRKTTTHKREA